MRQARPRPASPILPKATGQSQPHPPNSRQCDEPALAEPALIIATVPVRTSRSSPMRPAKPCPPESRQCDDPMRTRPHPCDLPSLARPTLANVTYRFQPRRLTVPTYPNPTRRNRSSRSPSFQATFRTGANHLQSKFVQRDTPARLSPSPAKATNQLSAIPAKATDLIQPHPFLPKRHTSSCPSQPKPYDEP